MTEMAPSGQTSPSATFNCPKCQNTITYYDVAGSSYYGCPVCRSFFWYENEGPPRILTSFANKPFSTIVLPIGTEGFLNGQFVRVVGFMHRKEAGTSYEWSEYVLLQQDGRYVQLAEYQGHWTFIRPTEKSYKPYHVSGNAHYVDSGVRLFRLYNRYSPEIISAVGEFDWNVLDDERLSVSEYIDPPYMLISEENKEQNAWYEGWHVNRDDVAKAFGIEAATLPYPIGIGAVEPADPKNQFSALVSFTGMTLVALLVLQIIISLAKPGKELLATLYRTQADSAGNAKPIITPSFDVNGPAALSFKLDASINNDWLELPFTLINEQSGKVYEFTKTLEYYHGVESGESWSEGSKEDEAILSRVPSGRYHINIYPANNAGQSVSFTLRVDQNPFLLANIGLYVGLLAIFPVALFWRRSWFNSQRWNNSDFADRSDEN